MEPVQILGGIILNLNLQKAKLVTLSVLFSTMANRKAQLYQRVKILLAPSITPFFLQYLIDKTGDTTQE